MQTVLLVTNVIALASVVALAFLVLGTLRALGVLHWRLDQMEAVRPSRIGREGLKIGCKAPNFILPCATGGNRSLDEFNGRKVLLVMAQADCGPCRDVIPELNRLQERGAYQVLVVNNGDVNATRHWAAEIHASFPVLTQEKLSVSKAYEVFVTPFAFLIDETGVIASKGIVSSRQYLGYVLSEVKNQSSYYEVDDSVAKTEQIHTSKSDFSLSIKE